MKIGDLVRIRKGIKDRENVASQLGVVLDVYEILTSAFYEVQFTYERGWFDEFELKVISEQKKK